MRRLIALVFLIASALIWAASCTAYVTPELTTLKEKTWAHLAGLRSSPRSSSEGSPTISTVEYDSVRVESYKVLRQKLGREYAWWLSGYISYEVKTHGVEDYVRVISAQLLHESLGGTRARSSAGARGLMQILPGTWGQVPPCHGDLYDPVVNIRCGVYIFAHYFKKCESDITCTLNWYSGYSRYADRPSPYVERVLGMTQ